MSEPAEFDAGAGRLLGTSGLQQAIDRFGADVDKLSGIVASSATDAGGGLLRAPAMSRNAEGATFTAGQFPPMGAWAGRAAAIGQGGQPGAPAAGTGFSKVAAAGGANGGGAVFAPAPGNAAPTLGQMAAGGGANGGGPSAGEAAYANWASGVRMRTTPTYGPWPKPIGPQPAPVPGGGGGGGSGSGGSGGGDGGGSGGGFAATAVKAAGMFSSSGLSQLSNQLLFNAYGQQTQAQWGQAAQGAQNSAFGYYNSSVNAAAAGNAQSAAAEFGTLNQMTGGGAIGQGSFLGATNALAFANQGLGAQGAAALAAQVYNPAGSLQMQMLTGVSAINGRTGQQNSLGSVISGLAGKGYLGGGGYTASGTFNQKALNASFTAGRGTSYMNLQSLGYGASQIQDIQSVMSQANQAAVKGGTSFQGVMDLMSQAQYGTQQQIESADSKLAKMGIAQSTIQKMGNQASLGMSQQQGESSGYNQAVSDFTSAMTRATQGVNYFLDHTGLGKAAGIAAGSAAGYSASGAKGWVSRGVSFAENPLGSVLSIAGIGGGAAAVSTTQQMGAVSRTAGSSLSSVPGQARTAVQDAEEQVGKPYVLGGASPATSFDCSGLVMWAYGQAGVKLPRTSEQQWNALKNRAVPLSQAREGDIVFASGADGSPSDPGHEALMISGNQIVEAPHTGANVRVRAYNAGEWQHAARPAGSVTSAGSGTPAVSTAGAQPRLAAGNSGAGITGGGGSGDASLGLTTDADSTLFSGAPAGAVPAPMATTSNGAAVTGSTGSTGSGSAAAAQSFTGGGSPAQNQALAKKMAQALYGWTGTQWTDGLLPLWMQESSWMTNAKNPSSGAYGIPQALPASKMATAGSDWLTNPATQVKWGLGYIKDRYGTPLDAEKFEKANHWYGAGTRAAAPGTALVGERGPELVTMSGGEQVRSAAQTASMLRGTSALPAQAPWTAAPAQQLVLDALSPANNHARGGTGGGGGVTVTIGTVSVNAPNLTGTQTTSDVQVLGQLIVRQVEDAIAESGLARDIMQGNTG